MTNEELQNLTEQWSLEKFERPFQHKIVFNRRLKTTGGRYHLRDHHIDINPNMIEEFDLATLQGVVLHELTHYHLHLSRQGYRHRDADFKQLLQQVGGSRYAPVSATHSQHLYRYQCQSCHRVITRQRKINVARYVCGACRGKLQLI